MKRIPLPIGVTIIILAGLLLSSVMAQGGAYTISAWVVAGGGGGSTGGVYGLDGTIGQAAAGRSTGGGYTLDSGYWALDEIGPVVISEPKIYLPMIHRPLPTPTPTPTPTPQVLLPCNDVEPNQGTAAAKPFLNNGQACIGSFMAPADDDDDWYLVTPNVGQTITVDLTKIPAPDDYDIYLYYGDKGNEFVASSIKGGQADETFTFVVDIQRNYYVRVFSPGAKLAATHTYVLKVSIQ
jgi:hypothetical protein